MGTPHTCGGGVSWGKLALNLAAIVKNTKPQYLEILEHNSEWLEQQQVQYNSISSQFDTKYFYEMYETELPGGRKLLVCVSMFPELCRLKTNVRYRLYLDTQHVLPEQ